MPTSATTPDRRSDRYPRYTQVVSTPTTRLSRRVHPNGTSKGVVTRSERPDPTTPRSHSLEASLPAYLAASVPGVFSVNELSSGRTRRLPVPEGHDQGREGGDACSRRRHATSSAPQTSMAAPQMPQVSSCRRFHRATGTKNTVNCLNSRIRVHWVVLWHRGQVRVSPGPRCCCLVPRPKKKITTGV
jgi:hypothetical protein